MGGDATRLSTAATSRTGQAIGVGTLATALTILIPMGFDAWKSSEDASDARLRFATESAADAHDDHVVSLNKVIDDYALVNGNLQSRLLTIQVELNSCYRDRVARTPVPPAVAAAIASQPMEPTDAD